MGSYSRLIEEAIAQLRRLPGIGSKTALRLALHILREDKGYAQRLAQSLTDMVQKIRYCACCHGLSDDEQCELCRDTGRKHDQICVVEEVQDVLAIEATSQYQGLYHVLGGLIAPLRGRTPDDLTILSLEKRVQKTHPKEIILALSATIEGDTTADYLSKKLSAYGVSVSSIARGIPVGSELEYADEITLGRSIRQRIPMNGQR